MAPPFSFARVRCKVAHDNLSQLGIAVQRQFSGRYESSDSIKLIVINLTAVRRSTAHCTFHEAVRRMYPYVVATMAQLLKKVATIILSEKCMEEYFDEFNFTHVECFKATLSTCLGFAIICGSLLVKLPQVVKIVKGRSAQGINIASVLLDLFAITSTVSYSFVSGFPFSAWGDGVFLGLQTLAIVILVLHFNFDTTRAATFLAAYVAVVAAAVSGMTPMKVLWACQTMNIPIVLISKLMQAHTNYSYGSTGQLSAVTGFMLFLGSLARIFTSIQETGDISMIMMYICSSLANSVIALQILYYWNVDVSSKEKSKKAQ